MNVRRFETPPRPKIMDQGLDIPPTPLLNSLGFGTGVNVWTLKSSVNSPWAVKNVRNAMKQESKDHFQQLITKEATLLSTIQHENIIGFRGLLKSVDGRHCLAMELGGLSLGELLEQREDFVKKPCTPQQIYKVVEGIAKALHYLHTEKKLLHGDIKSYNILINGDFKAVKLCDFGVSVELDSEGKVDSYTGTEVYNAPEVIDGMDDVPITAKAEIFSLGLVIWEMLTLSPPHVGDCEDSMYEGNDDSVIILDSSELSMQSSTAGTRPPLPAGLGAEYNNVIEIFLMCTEANPADRPTAEQLLNIVTTFSNTNLDVLV